MASCNSSTARNLEILFLWNLQSDPSNIFFSFWELSLRSNKYWRMLGEWMPSTGVIWSTPYSMPVHQRRQWVKENLRGDTYISKRGFIPYSFRKENRSLRLGSSKYYTFSIEFVFNEQYSRRATFCRPYGYKLASLLSPSHPSSSPTAQWITRSTPWPLMALTGMAAQLCVQAPSTPLGCLSSPRVMAAR